MMPLFEMYEPLPDGRKRLVSTFDSVTNDIRAVRGAAPVVLQRSTPKPAPLRTSQQPPATPPTPQPKLRTLSRAEAGRVVVAVLNDGVPQPPTLAQVVAERKRQGLMG